MKKSLEFNNFKELRDLINKKIQIKNNYNIKKNIDVDYIEENIEIKSIDYYYTNPIARSSKTMNECRKIKKNFLHTGIERAS